MNPPKNIVWFNGEFVAGKILLDPADRGLTLGDGLFETIAVHRGKPVWLAEHLARMSVASEELGISFDAKTALADILTILEKSTGDDEVLRVTLTRGVVAGRALANSGAGPNLMISLATFDGSNSAQTISLATSTIRRNETAPSSSMKTLSYIDAIAAAREVAASADDALMLNSAGHVASTTIGNLFALRGKELLTPAVDQAILPGIARAKILQHAKSMGLEPREAVLTLGELHTADAVFRTNSLRLVTQVTMLDGKALRQSSIQFIRDRLVSLREE